MNPSSHYYWITIEYEEFYICSQIHVYGRSHHCSYSLGGTCVQLALLTLLWNKRNPCSASLKSSSANYVPAQHSDQEANRDCTQSSLFIPAEQDCSHFSNKRKLCTCRESKQKGVQSKRLASLLACPPLS